MYLLFYKKTKWRFWPTQYLRDIKGSLLMQAEEKGIPLDKLATSIKYALI